MGNIKVRCIEVGIGEDKLIINNDIIKIHSKSFIADKLKNNKTVIPNLGDLITGYSKLDYDENKLLKKTRNEAKKILKGYIKDTEIQLKNYKQNLKQLKGDRKNEHYN